MVKASPEIARGISAVGRAKTYKRRGLWAIKRKNGGKFPTHPKKQVEEVATKPPKFYPADDISKPLARKFTPKAAKLRASITPGTVLILLAGRFKGKRVVFLKQLPSGLLLVTGPFKLNGVPARRVNQTYVIATSTKVELPALNLDKFTDAYFKSAEKKQRAKQNEDGFFNTEDAKKGPSAEHIQNQKDLDKSLLQALSDDLKGYLSTRFTLQGGDRPHLMKF